jgi:hypothetical protein
MPQTIACENFLLPRATSRDVLDILAVEIEAVEHDVVG